MQTTQHPLWLRLATSRPLGKRSESSLAAKRRTALYEIRRRTFLKVYLWLSRSSDLKRWTIISSPSTFSRRPLDSDFDVDFIYIYLFFKVVCEVEMKHLVCAAHDEIHTTLNCRYLCKKLIKIQLLAINLSWLVYFASAMEDELRRKKDAICLTSNSWHYSCPRSVYCRPGGHLGTFWVAMCRPGLQIGTPF